MLKRLVLADHAKYPSRNVVVSLLDGGVHADKLREAGVEVHSLGLKGFIHLPAAVLKLVLLMRRIRPSLVMTWLYHADFVGLLAAIISGIGADRVVWNLRCSNIDFSKYAISTRWVVSVLAWLSPLPRLISVNSHAGRRSHLTLGYRPRDWGFLPIGLDLKEYRPNERDRVLVRTELGLDATLFAVGMIARVDPQKDYATFLMAAKMVTAKYPHVRFILVGRNTDKLSVIESVTALGERHDIPRLLRGLDAFVLSSAFGEGTPNVLAEAMASGLPCITTNVGDAAVLVETCGIVISPQSPDELAAAIEALVSEAHQIRKLRGQLARKIIRQRHNIEHATDIYHQLCHKALHKHQGMLAVNPGVAA